MRVVGRIVIASWLIAAGWPVLASEPATPAQRPKAGNGITVQMRENIPCSCRANGVNYAAGSLVCLKGKLARCGFSLNNTSWQFLGRGCPTS
ncbi:MAG: hypothetical protein AB7O39_11065 [Flavobacteriaceae bacterium]